MSRPPASRADPRTRNGGRAGALTGGRCQGRGEAAALSRPCGGGDGECPSPQFPASLEVRGLAYGHPGRCLGRGLTFAVAPGEVLAVLGPNGTGKTTLFRTLLGLLPAMGGEIRLAGRDLARMTRGEAASAVAWVPQVHGALFPYSVREMVLMGTTVRLGLFGTPGVADQRAADGALSRLGLTPLTDRVFTTLSGGERQLVLIARALAQGARCVVMDEPCAHLDFGNQVRVLTTLRELAREGIAVVFSTHDPDHVFLAADRVALLEGGGLTAVGAPHEVVTAEALWRLYRVRVTVERREGGVTVCVPTLGGADCAPACADPACATRACAGPTPPRGG